MGIEAGMTVINVRKAKTHCVPGIDKGKIIISPDSDAPLPEIDV
jgi:hypothetical protein